MSGSGSGANRPGRNSSLGFVLPLTNAWLAIEIAYEHDMLPPDTYAVIEDDVRTAIATYPARACFSKYWVDSFPGQGSRHVIETVNKVLAEHGW